MVVFHKKETMYLTSHRNLTECNNGTKSLRSLMVEVFTVKSDPLEAQFGQTD